MESFFVASSFAIAAFAFKRTYVPFELKNRNRICDSTVSLCVFGTDADGVQRCGIVKEIPKKMRMLQ